MNREGNSAGPGREGGLAAGRHQSGIAGICLSEQVGEGRPHPGRRANCLEPIRGCGNPVRGSEALHQLSAGFGYSLHRNVFQTRASFPARCVAVETGTACLR